MSQNMLTENKVKDVFIQYKINIAKLYGKGKNNEEIVYLKDSNINEEKFFSLEAILKNSTNLTCKEEVMVNLVNFILSLFPKNERRMLLNEFYLDSEPFWYLKEMSRSSYYRNKVAICKKFVEYYEEVGLDKLI